MTSTITAEIQGAGELAIPELFADDFRKLGAALDWARVYNANRAWASAANELAAASRYARSLAATCAEFAQAADELRAESGQD